MTDYIKIEDSNDLSRDILSMAVINTNVNQLEQILASRAKRKQDAKDLADVKKDVDDIKKTLNKILEMLESKS